MYSLWRLLLMCRLKVWPVLELRARWRGTDVDLTKNEKWWSECKCLSYTLMSVVTIWQGSQVKMVLWTGVAELWGTLLMRPASWSCTCGPSEWAAAEGLIIADKLWLDGIREGWRNSNALLAGVSASVSPVKSRGERCFPKNWRSKGPGEVFLRCDSRSL